MSKTKNDAVETIEINTENKSIGNQATLMASNFTTPTKYGVYRFLQLYPQEKYVDAAMRFKYKSGAYTIPEWEKLLAKVKKTLGVKD